MSSPSPTGSNKGPASAYKSPQMSTVKALRSQSLISNLQAYIDSVEELAAQRKLELDKVVEREKELERDRRKEKRERVARSEEFDTITDMPPKLRSLTEDIKVLKDRVKKYKEKCTAHERTISAQQSQILKLTDKVAGLEETLQRCNRNPKQVMDEQRMLEELKSKQSTIEDLEHRLLVVTKSKEVETKKTRAIFADARRKEEDFKQEVAELKQLIEEKDKENRSGALKIRALQKKLEPQRRAPVPKPDPIPEPRPQPSPSSTFMTQAVPDAEAPEPTSVQLVVIVRGDGEAPAFAADGGEELFGEDAEAAAVRIQAVHRGRTARKQVLAEKEETAAAATRIQAVHRGRAARADVAAKRAAKQEEEEMAGAALKVQASYRGFQARREVASMREAAAGGGEEAAEGDEEAAMTSVSTKGNKVAGKVKAPPKGGKPNPPSQPRSGSGARPSIGKAAAKGK